MDTIRHIKPNITKCSKGRYGDPNCTAPATICQQSDWNTGNTKGTSFFYFCKNCYDKQNYEKH